jgi:lysophospholipase L1-like esterase
MMILVINPALSTHRRIRLCLVALLSVVLPILPMHAAKPAPSPDHWVGTWATADYAADNKENRFASGTTLRQIVHVSIGGPLVRLEFSNEAGVEPLTIGAAHIALTASGDSISLPSANALTFGGKPSITIPPGATAISDPAALNLPAFANLTVSLFLPAQKVSRVTFHNGAYQTNYAVPGNMVGQSSLASAGSSLQRSTSWFFLKAVDVKTYGETGVVVAFGDSITDGAHSSVDTNSRWPDVLARRLAAGKHTRDLGVLNEGIGGNRLLHDGTGPSALARFDKDVLSRPGVRYLIVLEGINDIGHAADPTAPYDIVSADDLIQALAQLAERAHTLGIKVFGATLTPYLGAKYASPAGEAMRQAYNQWIRTSNQLDGFIDFDKATSDPNNAFKPADDSGDHLHPNDAGYKAMGDAIDLKLFQPTK